MVMTVHCQQVLIAESYGGRDEPVDTLTNNFVGVGVEPVFEPVRVKEVPNEAAYQVCPARCKYCCVLIYSVCAQLKKCNAANRTLSMCCAVALICVCGFAWHTRCRHKRCNACVWLASHVHMLLTKTMVFDHSV